MAAVTSDLLGHLQTAIPVEFVILLCSILVTVLVFSQNNFILKAGTKSI